MMVIPKITLYFVVTASVLLISSCSTISTPKTQLIPIVATQNSTAKQPGSIHNQTIESQLNQAWKTYQKDLQSLTKWQASGVIGIVIDKKGESANFIWKQNNDNFWIQLYGPLGIGATTFSGNRQQVELMRSNGEITQAHDLQSLMQSQLGWSLPIEGLYYWARGLYMPQQSYTKTLNNFGLMQTLEQQGWQIQYSNYMLYDATYPLAEKIIFRYGDDLKITLVIKSWLLNP